MNPEVLKALAGGGLSAGDYAGLTPEQIQMVAGQGQQDRQLMLGAVKQQSDAEMEERKQAHTEMHNDRVFQVMQNQETRANYQLMMDAGFKAMGHQLEQRKLGLEQQKLSSALLTDETQRKLLNAQIDEVNKKASLVKNLETVMVELPFKNQDGTPATMNLGSLMAGGGSFAEKAFTYNLIKQSGGQWGEGGDDLGLSGLGGGTGKTTDAAKQRAVMQQYYTAKGLSPAMAKIASVGAKDKFYTPQDVIENRKNDTLFNTYPLEKRMELATEEAEAINAANFAVLQNTETDLLRSLSEQYDKSQASPPTGTGGGSDVNPNPAASNETTPQGANSDVIIHALDAAIQSVKGQELQKNYPEWFRYSETYGGYRLKPNIVQLATKEIGERVGQMATEADADLEKVEDLIIRYLMAKGKETSAPVSRADYLRAQFSR